MSAPLNVANSTIISAFESALLYQLLIVFAILAVLAISWNLLRTMQLRRAMQHPEGEEYAAANDLPVEPIARRVLRLGFGFLWAFDGILQIQTSMPLGLPSGALQPAAATSPKWIQDLVNFGVTIWNNHPVTAAASVVWIQLGVGLLLLLAPRGRWSQIAGAVSVGWGLVVWVFGEAFGGIFAPGLTLLFGAPGAVFVYVVAGALLMVPSRSWSARFGRRILIATGSFFVLMSVLQAWPGRGFWQGQTHNDSTSGSLVSMISDMAGTPQPQIFHGLVSSFGTFDAAHGFAVNLFFVLGFGVVGLAFIFGTQQIVRYAIWIGLLCCAIDWVCIEDIGFFGGIGTDPNNMIPIALVFIVGYLAWTRPQNDSVVVPIRTMTPPRDLAERWQRIVANPTYAFRGLAACGALGVILLGSAPMVAASTNSHADPIINAAIDGAPNATDTPAPGFSLSDQNGVRVSLASLRGKTVVVTFLDPVCTTDCPLIAQELRQANLQLTAQQRSKVEFVAIDVNPQYLSQAALQAFNTTEGLSKMSNWRFLTGPLSTLRNVWDDYGESTVVESGGAMVDHGDITYVIDASGHWRFILNADPGDGSGAQQSSASGVITQSILQSMQVSGQ